MLKFLLNLKHIFFKRKKKYSFTDVKKSFKLSILRFIKEFDIYKKTTKNITYKNFEIEVSKLFEEPGISLNRFNSDFIINLYLSIDDLPLNKCNAAKEVMKEIFQEHWYQYIIIFLDENDIRKKFEKNIAKEGKTIKKYLRTSLIDNYRRLSDFFNIAFCWADTKEGVDFWVGIHTKLVNQLENDR